MFSNKPDFNPNKVNLDPTTNNRYGVFDRITSFMKDQKEEAPKVGTSVKDKYE
jgi:hypothetical protein